MTDYRARIYREYASRMQDAEDVFNKEKAERWGVPYKTFLRGWLPHNKDAATLDVGCGWGKLLHFFKSRGYINISGVDISPEQVALARQVTGDVVESDAIEFLQARSAGYDLVIGLDIVEHFKKDDVLPFLDACYNALRPGGRIVLQTPNAESIFGMKIRYGDFTHETAFDPSSLKKLLALCGFIEIEGREAGPAVHGVVSLARYFIWKVIRAALALYSLSETGDMGSGIYTRVFLMSGIKGDN